MYRAAVGLDMVAIILFMAALLTENYELLAIGWGVLISGIILTFVSLYLAWWQR